MEESERATDCRERLPKLMSFIILMKTAALPGRSTPRQFKVPVLICVSMVVAINLVFGSALFVVSSWGCLVGSPSASSSNVYLASSFIPFSLPSASPRSWGVGVMEQDFLIFDDCFLPLGFVGRTMLPSLGTSPGLSLAQVSDFPLGLLSSKTRQVSGP